ncbi:MAG: LURP-one-related family protein [Clostridia bacterium]|nr:LURP-one-related family protein [Clostridia bacterium]
MKLLFKQRMFSWFDSYDVYNEAGDILYTVRGDIAWGHLLRIYDGHGREIGVVKERVLTWLPKFEMHLGGRYVGSIRKELTFFRPRFLIDCNGWQVEGDWFEWDYHILDERGHSIAYVNKQLFNWTDTYVIDVRDPNHATCILMLVLAIDAEKCSRRD